MTELELMDDTHKTARGEWHGSKRHLHALRLQARVEYR